MARLRKTNPDFPNFPFDLDRSVRNAIKLMNRVINQLEQEGKIPTKRPVRKAQRT